MRLIPTRFAAVVAAPLLTVMSLLTACGGGGSSGPGTPPPGQQQVSVPGSYWFFSVTGDHDATQDVSSSLGDLAFAADGNVTGSISQGGGTTPFSGFTWTREQDGRFGWNAAGMEVLQGGLPASKVGVLGSKANGIDPLAGILFPQGTGMSVSAMNGLYHYVSYYHFSPSTNVVGLRTLTFDGAGTSTGVSGFERNADGTISQAGVGGPFAYTISPNGRFVLAGFSEGAVIDGGDLAIYTNEGTDATMGIILKAATAATNATFSGEYWFISFQHHNNAPNFESATGTLTADGVGGFTASNTTNTDGSIAAAGIGGSVTVTADGTMTGVIQFGATLRGAISADGSYGVLGGGTSAGDNPQILFFVKK